MESGEYFLKSHQKEAKEAQRRKEKVRWIDNSVGLLTADKVPLNTARRGYREAAGGTSRSVCTSEGRRSSYSGGKEEAQAEGRGGGRDGWRETSQDQAEKEEIHRGLLVSYRLACCFVLPPLPMLGSCPIAFQGELQEEEEFSKLLALDPNKAKQTDLGPVRTSVGSLQESGVILKDLQDRERLQSRLHPVPSSDQAR